MTEKFSQEKKSDLGLLDPISTAQGESTPGIKRLNFSDSSQREAHISAFLAWLPKTLQEAPGIDWARLPSRTMGYLMRNAANSPDAIPITLAIGCAMDGMRNHGLYTNASHLTGLLRRLRAQYGLQELSQLKDRHTWEQFIAGRTLSSGEISVLVAYDTLSSLYLRSYLEQLPLKERLIWERYALPRLPAGLVEKQGNAKAVRAASVQRRKEQSDVLVPLYPLLVEIVQLRKQAVERLIKQFRKHRDRAIAGEIDLPYHFQHTDRLIFVSEDATVLSEAKLIEREVTLSLTLWDRSSWVKERFEQLSSSMRSNWKLQLAAYAPEKNTYFLQYEGPLCDLFWFGDLIEKRLLGAPPVAVARERKGHPQKRGSDQYLRVKRPGVLSPLSSDSVWLRLSARSGEILFEPETLYRGVLFAAALATLALTNGSRVSELLQVSATRFETLVVDELKNQQPTGRRIAILVQNLLPKGSTQENERQFFLISEMAGRLLTEIGQQLEAAHGGSIPVVQPLSQTKEEDLRPEPYLFQWSASPDGLRGLLAYSDVGILLRFFFHGLTLTTRKGTPIRVAAHLLRHVLATHARQVQKVPAEAVAFLLHHRVILPNMTRTLTISEATAYYSRMTMEQVLALLAEAQSVLAPDHPPSYLYVPPPRTLEELDEAVRRTIEQWGLIGPTVLGFCSAGMCVRPDNRGLCANCEHLVPHYSNLNNAKTWRRLFVLQAKMHEAHGHYVDAKQARQIVQYLDNIIAVMQIQIRTRQDGGYLPFADSLPPAQDGEEGGAK